MYFYFKDRILRTLAPSVATFWKKCSGLLPEKEQTMKDVKNLLQTKVHEVYENNTHDHFIIKGQSGDEKDDQIVNANCKIVYFTQYIKQVHSHSLKATDQGSADGHGR